jgi:hypothetical protein
MGRLPLLLMLLLIAGIVNPGLRARAEPYAKPHVDRALSPFYEWSVRHRLGEISRALQERRARGFEHPNSGDLSRFLQQFYREETAHLDPWGMPFYISQDGQFVRVGSAGRDGIIGTLDDVHSARIPR